MTERNMNQNDYDRSDINPTAPSLTLQQYNELLRFGLI